MATAIIPALMPGRRDPAIACGITVTAVCPVPGDTPAFTGDGMTTGTVTKQMFAVTDITG